MTEDVGRPEPNWSAFEAVPVAVAWFVVTVLALALLPFAFGARTAIVLAGLVSAAALAGFTLLWVRLRPGASPAALGLTKHGGVGRQLGIGLLLGLALFAVTVLVVAPALYALISLLVGESVTPPQQEVLPEGATDLHRYLGAVAVVVAAPIGEELFFRGFLFGGLRRNLPFWGAALISSAVFALVHVIPLLMPLFLLVGLGLAWIYERRRSLPAAIAAHAGFNLVGYALILARGG